MATPDYRAAARQYASGVGIDPTIFVNQIQAESGFNPGVTSSAGAQGIAQFMPATAAGLRINPWDPLVALQAAAGLDSRNLKVYGGDYSKMLAAYNAGGGAVNNAVSRYGSAWLSHMPAETQNYVANIIKASGGGVGVVAATSAAQGAATAGATAPTAADSTGGILAQLKTWGEYIAIFGIALVLMVIGFLLIGGKGAVQAARGAI